MAAKTASGNRFITVKKMPSLEISKKDLEQLAGKKFKTTEELENALMYAKTELDSLEGDVVKCSPSDTNRPDLYSTEGIARELKSHFGLQTGIPKYAIKKGNIKVTVDKSVEKILPLFVGAVIRNVHVTEDLLIQMIQLQEKVTTTFGRRRKEAAIGIYDFDKMKPPFFFKAFKDNEIEFIPLEYKVPMRPSEILAEHPKGKEFRHLLAGVDRYPIIIDSANQVASMPPVINSQHTGKVTETTKNLFIEVTGHKLETIKTTLNVMVMALADRGGTIESIEIEYPKTKTYPVQKLTSPIFDTETIKVSKQLVTRLTGLALNDQQVVKLLGRSGFHVKTTKTDYLVEYPSYRQDILHPVDIIEDLLITYGYNDIPLAPLSVAVVGKELANATYADHAGEACIGMGFQQILTYNLTSVEKQTRLIGIEKEEFAQIANPVSQSYEVFRKRIYPELLEFLSKNKHASYPQKIFETGKTLSLDAASETGCREKFTLSMAIASNTTNFTEIKSHAVALAKYLGHQIEFFERTHESFEKGKTAGFTINGKKGICGELNQKVIDNFGLKTRVTILEIEL